MKTVHNRFYNTLPKIGIRPTIDGRRNGVRESLEDMTMNLAKSVANLLTENLRHYNGEAVELSSLIHVLAVWLKRPKRLKNLR